MIYRKKSTTYYVAVLLTFGLAFGFGTAAITGGGILSADPSLEKAAHESDWIIYHDEHGNHHQTLLGNLLFGRALEAHAGWFCGHDERTVWIDGKMHRQVFRYHSDGDVHHYKGAHYYWTGTGYARLSDWWYEKVQC